MTDAAHTVKRELTSPSNGMPPSERAVLEELNRVLESSTFRPANRMKRLLAFVVRETLAGRSATLREFVIGVQVFEKEGTFDPRVDPIVRVQARRLRAKLVEYQRAQGRSDGIVIDLPKGSYVPTFRTRNTPVDVEPGTSTPVVHLNAVVILPFVDLSETGSLSVFCRGLREEVLHQLTRLTGVRTLANTGLDAHEPDGIAARARAVVEGSVRQVGDRLRVTVRLREGSSDSYLWSESINATLEDILEGQERVAEIIRRRLETDLPESRPKPEETPVEDLAAQNLYLQGRFHLNQRADDGLRKAIGFFEKSLAEDAQFAPAHSGLADAYALLTHYGVVPPSEAWAKAALCAATAVMLDTRSAEAHTSLAHVRAAQDWDWKGAEQEFQRALHLGPRYATAHHWYAASCLAPLGRLDEALDEMMIARSIDPVSSIVARDLAMMHFFRRDFETALEHCDQTIAINPHFAPAYWLLGIIQEQMHDFDESSAAFQRALHLWPQSPRMQGALGRTLALSGRRGQALEMLRKLQTHATTHYVSPIEFAWIAFGIGDPDSGFRWLAKACDHRSFDLIAARVDPRFDLVRDDERFQPVLKALNFGD